VNPANFKELCEQVAISVRHLRYLLEQIEWHIPKATVWAFGSRIKWSHRPESDLDLAVHCDKETARKALPKLNDALQESDLPFKVQILDFNRLPENMQENIKKNYLVLYQRQEKPLPSDWKETTLGEVAEVQTGPFGSQLHEEDYVANGTPIITVENLVNDHINHSSDTPKVSEEDKARLARYILNEGDIVFSRVGSVDRCGYVSPKEDGWLFSGRLLRVRPAKEMFNKYVFYWISQQQIKEYVRKIAVGATMPSINTELLSQVPISFPPLPEQKAIAAILSSLDDKIELLRRQNKTLETIAQALFRKWFIEEAQEDWETVRIGDFVKTNALSINNDFALEIIKYLDTSSITEGEINGVQYLNIKDLPSRAKRIVKHNDILISTVRPDQKHYGIMKRPAENLIVSTGFCVITCDTIDPHYIYILLTTVEMTEYLHLIAEGTTSAYPSLKPSDIEKIEFQRPPKEKLCAFSKYADKAWDKIDNNYSQIQTLSKLRDSLLPKLMKGEIRVKDADSLVKERIK